MGLTNGLSTPYVVRQDRVFFRAEFRSTEMMLSRRRHVWAKLVRDAILKLVSRKNQGADDSVVEMESKSEDEEEQAEGEGRGRR